MLSLALGTLALGTVALLVAACGYTVGDPDAPAIERAGTRRVSVTLFRNSTTPYEPGIERDLHAALLKEILPGPYVLVNPSEADLFVEGTVLEFRERITARDSADAAIAVSLRLTVVVRCRTRDGRRWESEPIAQSTAIALARGESVSDARERLMREVARRALRAFVPEGAQWHRRAQQSRRAERVLPHVLLLRRARDGASTSSIHHDRRRPKAPRS